MKISKKKNFQQCLFKVSRGNEDGFAITIVFIILLAIMVLLVTANSTALIHLHREVKFLEQQQIKRLNGVRIESVTGTLSTTNSIKNE
jgi:hypothetical protein